MSYGLFVLGAEEVGFRIPVYGGRLAMGGA